MTSTTLSTIIDGPRLARSKRAFSTRRVSPRHMATLITGDARPNAGDLVLARVDLLGKQTKLELTDGRRAHMFLGDEIIVCYGNRYAPDQFEAIVSDDLAPCDLVAAGGIAGIELSRHGRMKPPTQITPLGLIGDRSGKRLNVAQFRVSAEEHVPNLPVILSLGTSMNAGKTLTSTSLVRGLKRAGFKVAALKVTGTGAGGDMWIVRDAGADLALDFTDAGFASTYLAPIEQIEAGTFRLVNYAADTGCDVAVIEIADGLQQEETAQLVRSPRLRDITVGCTFAAYDSMGAISGHRLLKDAGHAVLGLSGRIGLSPLGVREAELATGSRVYLPWELQDGALVPAIKRRAAELLDTAPADRTGALRTLARDMLPGGAGEVARGPSGGAAAEERRVAAWAKEVLTRAADHVMDREIAARCGAGLRFRVAGRLNRRNGFRLRHWASVVGNIDLKVPRLRHGTYRPSFLDASGLGTIAAIEVEAVVRAADVETREKALLRLLRSLGGPTFGRADALLLNAQLGPVTREDYFPTLPEQEDPTDADWSLDDDGDMDDVEAEAAAFAGVLRVATGGTVEEPRLLPDGRGRHGVVPAWSR